MPLRHDTTWRSVVGRRVWAKYAHNPVMLEFTVHCVWRRHDSVERMLIDHKPVWTDSAVDFDGGLFAVDTAAFVLLDA